MQSWLRSEPPLAQEGLLEAGVPWLLALHWLQLPQPLQERQALSVAGPARAVDSGSVASTELLPGWPLPPTATTCGEPFFAVDPSNGYYRA